MKFEPYTLKFIKLSTNKLMAEVAFLSLHFCAHSTVVGPKFCMLTKYWVSSAVHTLQSWGQNFVG